MINTAKRPTGSHTGRENAQHKQLLPQRALEELLAETLTRGYHGTAAVSFTVQDGHVQHVKVSTERQVR